MYPHSGVGVGVCGTKNTSGVPASAGGIGVRRARIDAGSGLAVGLGTGLAPEGVRLTGARVGAWESALGRAKMEKASHPTATMPPINPTPVTAQRQLIRSFRPAEDRTELAVGICRREMRGAAAQSPSWGARAPSTTSPRRTPRLVGSSLSADSRQ